jgi:predicted nucleotidyltransferase
MEAELQKFVHELVASNLDISSIWLFGSRANGTAKALSDWDIFVFGTGKTFDEIEKNEFFHRGAVDLMVVTDGEHFRKPYGGNKSGSLSDWKWNETGVNEAEYEGVKFIPDEPGSDLGEFKRTILKARRLFPGG